MSVREAVKHDELENLTEPSNDGGLMKTVTISLQLQVDFECPYLSITLN